MTSAPQDGVATAPAPRTSLIRRVLGPPPVEPDAREAAATLAGTGWALIAVSAVAMPVLIALLPSAAARWVGFSGAQIALGAGAVLLARIGRTRFAAHLIVTGMGLVSIIGGWTGGGLEAPIIAGLFVFVALAALVLSWRGGVVAAVVAMATIVFLAWAAATGRLPDPSFAHTPWSRAAVVTIYTALGMALILVATLNLRRSRERVQDELRRREAAQDELRRAQDELAALNADLETRIEERTEQYVAASRELETFAYSVSHDLRTPLRAIDGFSELVLEDEGAALSPDARADLRRVRAAAQRMGLLIDDLLALSRLSRTQLDIGIVDLSRLADEIATRLAEQQPRRRVTFTATPGLRALTDPGLAEALLANLLENAWKFTAGRDEAHVSFTAREEAGERVFCVRDDGAGFDPAHVDKLFQPFQRLHAQDEYPGTGIGLATVRRIVTRFGGRCWAEGAPGEGASFFLTLPETEA